MKAFPFKLDFSISAVRVKDYRAENIRHVLYCRAAKPIRKKEAGDSESNRDRPPYTDLPARES